MKKDQKRNSKHIIKAHVKRFQSQVRSWKSIVLRARQEQGSARYVIKVLCLRSALHRSALAHTEHLIPTPGALPAELAFMTLCEFDIPFMS